MQAFSTRAALTILAVSLLAGGCSAVKEPKASFRSAAIREVNAEGLTVDFLLDVKNPNAFELPITDARYGLALEDVQVVDGTIKPAGALPAGGTAPVTVPVRLTFDSLLRAERAVARSGGNIPYSFDGSLGFSTTQMPMFAPLRVPVKFSGTLPLRDTLTDPRVLTGPAGRKLLELIGIKSPLDLLLPK